METSDSCHLMITSDENIAKFQPEAKSEPEARNYDYFKNDLFRDKINILISKFGNYNDLKNMFVPVLDKHPPRKISFNRANNKPHISKSFRKEVLCISC